MPFDDFKTLPEGLAVTPTMQPVAWAVPDRDDGEIWYVTMWRDEAIRAAGGNVVREAVPVKGGTTIIAFVQDPDGYKVELIQR